MNNRIKKIQDYLKNNKFDAFFVPREDQYLNEYLPSAFERLKWLTNFSGSSGIAIILKKKSPIFTDGRYTIQINQEVNKNLFSVFHINEFNYWIKKNLFNYTVAFDPWLFSIHKFNSIKKNLSYNKIKFIQLTKNPIDTLWKNRPSLPKTKAYLHGIKYTGESVIKKILKTQKIIKRKKSDYLLLTSIDSIAWLLNLRGNDIDYIPLNLAYALVPNKGKIILYINKKKISQKIIKHFYSSVVFKNDSEIIDIYKIIPKKSIVGIDIKKTPYAFKTIFSKNSIKIKYFDDPCYKLKSVKNKVELKGARKANIRDGASLTKFLYWITKHKKLKSIDEMLAEKKLLKIRKRNEYFVSPSFSTISAFGANASVPHYRVSRKTNVKFSKDSLYLVDSGGQYFDGTTDITRTIALGKPTNEQKDRFTRVLKGHIALSTVIFSRKTKGSDLDYLARKFLKKINCDYDHGTGHGIGSFLSVHEGPQRISKLPRKYDCFLKNGMILSNEPGYYKKDEYGIRIENLIIVNKLKNNKLKFETISWAPLDKEMILLEMLTKAEIRWINSYHKKVYNKINKHLNLKEKNWLKNITKPI
tara:strand:- start:28 stop:1782 length:1755 start_codon:yes stop_codon:yes gene_type:complete